jgi:hypothetical protein
MSNKGIGNVSTYVRYSSIDIDECLVGNGGCSQHCQNSVPGYMCYCDPGFFLSADSHTCFGKWQNYRTFGASVSTHINIHDASGAHYSVLLFLPTLYTQM